MNQRIIHKYTTLKIPYKIDQKIQCRTSQLRQLQHFLIQRRQMRVQAYHMKILGSPFLIEDVFLLCVSQLQ
jgi:hypothetical protein